MLPLERGNKILKKALSWMRENLVTPGERSVAEPSISTIRLQSQQSDCNLSNQLAFREKYQQSESTPCILTNSIILIPLPCGRTHATSPTRGRMTYRKCKLPNFAISAIRLQSQQSDCNPPALQSDCWDCSWIVEIAVWFWRLQLDCGDCSVIAEIAVWLWRLQLDCGDCRWIV